MCTRYVSAVLVAVAILFGQGQAGLAQQNESERGGEFVCQNLDASRLNLQEPVPINGPFPRLVREAEVGDLIQLQVSYPMAPPFPKKVCAKVGSRALSAEDVASTANRVAILGPKPQTGLIGSGYFSVYLRAHTAGTTSAKVTVNMSDGTKKEVPFAFTIKQRASLEDDSVPGTRSGRIEVFAYPYKLTREDKLADGPTPEAQRIDIVQDTMLLWVDLAPTAYYAHPTRYALISGKSATVVKGEWWPVLNGKPLFRGPNQAAVIAPTVLDRIRPEVAEQQGQVKVFLYPYELTSSDKLKDGPVKDHKPYPIEAETMLVWVDLLPEAKFAHPTLFVLISADDIRVDKGQWWPVLNGKPLFTGPNNAAVASPTVLRQP